MILGAYAAKLGVRLAVYTKGGMSMANEHLVRAKEKLKLSRTRDTLRIDGRAGVLLVHYMWKVANCVYDWGLVFHFKHHRQSHTA